MALTLNRVIDETYYEAALLSYLMRIGTITQPNPNHQNPLDYGLSREESIKIRIRYLNGLIQPLKDELSQIKGQYLRGERPHAHIPMNALQEKISKLEKSVHFNRERLKCQEDKSYDLEAIKRVPINQITEVMANGFFRTNPFRNEKSPSNSLFWYRKDNRFCDFATGKTGDVIDVYMAVQNCDMKTALKELSCG